MITRFDFWILDFIQAHVVSPVLTSFLSFLPVLATTVHSGFFSASDCYAFKKPEKWELDSWYALQLNIRSAAQS